VAVGLLLRLLPLLCHHQHPSLFLDPDSPGYHRLAVNLLAGHGYSWNESPPYRPNLYRPPGLPLLLAALYALTGASLLHAIALQVVVAGATLALTYVLVAAWTKDGRLALLATAALAVDPVAIYYANFLLTEVYSALIVVAAMLLATAYLQTASRGYLVGLGLLLGVGIMMHPLLLLSPLLAAALPALSPATRTRSHALAALAAMLLAWAPAAGWACRNYRVGDYLGISSVTSVNLLKYKAAGVLALRNGTSREAERDRLAEECEAELPPAATEGERYRLWQAKATAILRADPWGYAMVHLRGDAVQLLGVERDHLARFLYGGLVLDQSGRVTDASIQAARARHRSRGREAVRAALLAQALLLLALAVGVVTAALRRRWAWLGLLVPAAYVLALAGGPEASPRFRTVYLPLLCAFTGYGLQVLWGWLRAAAAALNRPRRVALMPQLAR
jgi:4-amino-4-deoxy-L-arabinose transferase-like glycosyltransferase